MVFSTYLDSRDQLLRLNLSFWELSEVVAHSGVVAKVDLVRNEDDGDDKKHDSYPIHEDDAKKDAWLRWTARTSCVSYVVLC